MELDELTKVPSDFVPRSNGLRNVMSANACTCCRPDGRGLGRVVAA